MDALLFAYIATWPLNELCGYALGLWLRAPKTPIDRLRNP